MIASVRGTVQQVGPDYLVLEVGGVGLRIATPLTVIQDVPVAGIELFLHTFLVVREDALTLYGFSSVEERETFELFNQVPGVGPRLALAMLSHLSLDQLRASIVENRPEALSQVPGIGKKKAEKIIFELRDKLEAPPGVLDLPIGIDGELLGVLSSLGYSAAESRAAIQSLPAEAPGELEERIRLALQYFTS